MWSLGIVLYAMCFSSLPFHHDDDPTILKGIIKRFADERECEVGQLGDPAGWLPRDPSGRLGSLRLVVAALLSLDEGRRPEATDLLENPSFRAEALRHAAQHGGEHAALPELEGGT